MKKPKRAKAPTVANENVDLARVFNGLSEAIMGFTPGGIGTQLSQVDTIFKNNRWYMLSNMRQVLSQVYVEHGLIQTLVDVPVDDGMRGGYEIQTKQLNPEQIHELQICLERESINSQVIGQAMKWNRLFGGAGILILTGQDQRSPLNLAALKPDSPLEFRAVDMWELFWNKQNTEGVDPTGNMAMADTEYYNYYGLQVHKSRVLVLKGITAPSFVRPRLRGWGFSVVEGLVRSINQYVKSNELIFEVLDEFKLDIFKINNLTQTLASKDGTNKVKQRVQLANQQKNFQNAMVLDGKDDYVQKQLTFSGLAEMMKEFRIQIASDLRIPMTKLFGLSASGFNSGEDDIEVYNAMVESQVREKARGVVVRVLEVLSAKLFGIIPEDLEIEFKPLRVLSSEQEETVKTQRLNRLIQAYDKGMMTSKEFKEACNKDNLLGVQVDPDVDPMDSEEGDGGGDADSEDQDSDEQKEEDAE